MSSYKMYQTLFNNAQAKEKPLTMITRDNRAIIDNTLLANLNKSIAKYNAMRTGPEKETMLELIKQRVSAKINKRSTKADTRESLTNWLGSLFNQHQNKAQVKPAQPVPTNHEIKKKF